MNLGHGITAFSLEQACANGIFRAPGERCLLEAVWQEQAHKSTAELTLGADGRNRLNVMDAICFRVLDIGPEVPESWGMKRGDIVINVSISGEKVSTNQQSPFVVVHYRDIVGIIDAEALQAQRSA